MKVLGKVWHWFLGLNFGRRLLLLVFAVPFIWIVGRAAYISLAPYYLAHKYRGQAVRIVLTHDKTLEEPSIYIPVDYFGPTRLRMIQDNMKGGHHRMVGLQLGFPSLTPWKGEKSMAKGDELVALVIRQGHEGSARWSWSLRKKHLDFVEHDAIGIDRYRFGRGAVSPHSMANDLFYFADTTAEINSVYIDCNVSSRGQMPKRCKFKSSPKGVHYSYNIGIPSETLPQWRETVSRLNTLVSSFSTSPDFK